MEILYKVLGFFQSGGVFMYPILLILAIGVAIAVERYVYLTLVRSRNRGVWKRVLPLLESGRYESARDLVMRSDAAVSRILGYGLNRAERSGSGEEIQMAMEEGLLEVVPRLEKRTHYLAMFANIATLLGLLGTIIGLIQAFAALESAAPDQRAQALAKGISIAMNTTAFGLIVAIPCMGAQMFLQAVTKKILEEIDQYSVKLENLLVSRIRAGSQ